MFAAYHGINLWWWLVLRHPFCNKFPTCSHVCCLFCWRFCIWFKNGFSSNEIFLHVFLWIFASFPNRGYTSTTLICRASIFTECKLQGYVRATPCCLYGDGFLKIPLQINVLLCKMDVWMKLISFNFQGWGSYKMRFIKGTCSPIL